MLLLFVKTFSNSLLNFLWLIINFEIIFYYLLNYFLLHKLVQSNFSVMIFIIIYIFFKYLLDLINMIHLSSLIFLTHLIII